MRPGLVARIGVGAAAGAFDPLSLSPSAWWKADSMAHADGTAIATWPDSSGNARDLTQATGAKQPLFKTAIQNGLPVVRLDGTDDVMRAAGFVPLNANGTALTVFAVVKTANTTQGHLLSTRQATDGFLMRTNQISGIWGWFAVGGGSSSDTVTQTVWHVLECICTLTTIGSAGSMQAGHDGTFIAATATAPVQTASPQSGIDLGAQTNGSSAFMAGDVGEILLYPTALGTTDRQNVEAYLKAKWATP